VIRGWRVLHEKRCVQCHAVWGQGGQIGPDLGRSGGGHLGASDLAGSMWNHVPRMVALMRQYQLPEITPSRTEMADLFSFLYFARYLDEPGDPQAGRRVLEQKRCIECHEQDLERSAEGVGPRLTSWSGFVNPITWAQMMWEHSAAMEEALKKAGIERPELQDDDLANIIAYVRSIGASTTRKQYLRPGSPARGETLFTERKCASCHSAVGAAGPKAPDLSRIDLPPSLSALASRMWNHLPSMRKAMAEQKVEAASLTAQEMADIIAFVFASQYAGEPGDAARGARVFARKRCNECHTLSQPGPGAASAKSPSAADMAHLIWQHGAGMADQMTKAGIAWPTFERGEMADLIAHIKAVGSIAVERRSAPAGTPPGASKGEHK
jgi:cytochrome c2